MSAYIDILLLKSAIGIGDSNDDALLQQSIDAASAWIDQYTGRSFTAEAAATKYFYPTSATLLNLSPDLRTVITVHVDTSGNGTYATALTNGTHFLPMPLQSLPDAGIYSSLSILGNSSLSFGTGQRVRVVGDWGYVVGGQPPATIQRACLIQAARYFKRKEAPFGVLQTTDLGQFTRLSKLDPDVEMLLKPYKTASQSWLMV
jgi:hypothetical protein